MKPYTIIYRITENYMYETIVMPDAEPCVLLEAARDALFDAVGAECGVSTPAEIVVHAIIEGNVEIPYIEPF